MSFARIFQLSRKQSILAAVLALATFFGFGILRVQERQSAPIALTQEERSIASIGDTELPEGLGESSPSSASVGEPDNQSPFTLKTFRRSEVRDGKKVWEIVAAEGRYFPEKNEAEVEAPELFVFTEDGAEVRVLAKRAKLFLAGTGLVSAVLEGDVRVIRNDELTIETERAEYDKVAGRVHAAGFVKLSSPSFDVSGVGAEVEIESQIVKLLASVESMVKPREAVTAAVADAGKQPRKGRAQRHKAQE